MYNLYPPLTELWVSLPHTPDVLLGVRGIGENLYDILNDKSAATGFTEVKREELTPEVLFAALTCSMSNLTAALDGAWEAGRRGGMVDAEETMLLAKKGSVALLVARSSR